MNTSGNKRQIGAVCRRAMSFNPAAVVESLPVVCAPNAKCHNGPGEQSADPESTMKFK